MRFDPKITRINVNEKAFNSMRENLIESNNLLTEIQELGKLGNWSYDLVKNTTYWSEGLRKVKGVSSDFVPDFDVFLHMINPADKEMVIHAVEQAMETGSEVQLYYRFFRSNDKEERIFYTVIHIDLNPDNQAVRLYGIAQDVTEIKQAEEKIKKSESNLLAIFENTDAFIYSIDKECRYITFNTAHKKILKEIFNLDIAPGDNVFEFLNASDPLGAQNWKEIYSTAFKGESLKFIKDFSTEEYQSFSQFYINPIWENNYVTGLSCFARDVTQQKIAEDKIVQTGRLLSEAQKLANAGNWNVDVVKNEIFWSEGTREIYGVDSDFIPGFNVFIDMVHPEDQARVAEKIAEGQRTGNDIADVYRIVRPDGDERTLKTKTSFVLSKEGKLLRIYGISLDITALKNSEYKLEKTLKELEQRVYERTLELNLKNERITDSIRYSKRIQTALLSQHNKLGELFPQSFMFSRPKDIVSGDFFWCHQTRHKKFIAVADCTGHGVPAALMSIICNNLLKEVVIDLHIENPAEILETLDRKLYETLNDGQVEMNDGMDIGILVVDNQFKEIYYAGAYRPLFYFNGSNEMNELAGSPYPIGGLQVSNKKFEVHRLSPGQNQCIYMTSDGYYSQFGGDKDKKFMKKKFRELLFSLRETAVDEQEKILTETFDNWKKNTEQTDDVMVVGIAFN